MNILLYISSLDTGGAEVQTIRLANALGSAGHEVWLCCNHPVKTLPVRLAAIDNIHLQPLFGSAPDARVLKHLALLLSGFRLARVIRKTRAEVLYSSLYASNAAAAIATLLVREKPVLVWSLRTVQAKKKFLIRIWFVLCRLLSGRVDVFFSNTKIGLEYHKESGFNIRKSVILPNIIDFEYFTPGAQGRAGRLRVGVVGRIDKTKNIACAMRAYARARTIIELAPLQIVGPVSDSNYNQALHALCEELNITGEVLWLGASADVREVYRGLDVLINSSFTEGFSNVLCEAMSCDVFCITTPAGESAAIVGDSGVTVAHDDDVAIADAVVGYCRGEYADLESPRASLQRRFSKHAGVDVFIESVSGVVGC